MRELKFRAWDKQNNKMFNVISLTINSEKIKRVTIMGWRDLPVTSRTHYYSAKSQHIFDPHFELMQYTGLEDKNGVKIYEGDILRKPKRPYEYKTNGNEYKTIIWDDGQCGFNTNSKLSGWEVIGNIYANKELIK